MAADREVFVHLLPSLAEHGRLAGGVAVVIDVLRATTTIIHALAAGCKEVIPCLEVDEARRIAGQYPPGQALLGGEREGKPLPGFDLGNSPSEYSAERCRGKTVVMTTTNGTRALIRAAEAERALVAGFVNFTAVCAELARQTRPVHIICAGTDGEITLEDTLLAGAFVDHLKKVSEARFNDSASLAFCCFETNRRLPLAGVLETGKGGANLLDLGYDADIRLAAEVDKFPLVPELRRDPLRVA
jgi:2-phosphosulfolactate phosphatase